MIPDKDTIIKELGITDDIFKELLVCFFEQTDDSLKKLDEAVINGDLEEVSRLGHFIKGAAANIRLEDISALAHSIEILEKETAQNWKETAQEKASQLKVATDKARVFFG